MKKMPMAGDMQGEMDDGIQEEPMAEDAQGDLGNMPTIQISAADVPEPMEEGDTCTVTQKCTVTAVEMQGDQPSQYTLSATETNVAPDQSAPALPVKGNARATGKFGDMLRQEPPATQKEE
jgi:hypothetical protein